VKTVTYLYLLYILASKIRVNCHPPESLRSRVCIGWFPEALIICIIAAMGYGTWFWEPRNDRGSRQRQAAEFHCGEDFGSASKWSVRFFFYLSIVRARRRSNLGSIQVSICIEN
jgi:hypothetical protein